VQSVVIRGVDIRLIEKQRAELVTLRGDLINADSAFANSIETVSGMIHLLDAVVDRYAAGKTLDDNQLDRSVKILEPVLERCGHEDFTTKLEDRTLASVIGFLKEVS